MLRTSPFDRTCVVCLAVMSGVAAFPAATATAQPATSYTTALTALKELRSSANAFHDAVSRARHPPAGSKQASLVKRARTLAQSARKRASRLRKAIQELEKAGGRNNTTRYLRDRLAWYEKVIQEASGNLPAPRPAPAPRPPRRPAPRPKRPGSQPAPPAPLPRPASTPAAIDRQVKQLLQEIRAYEQWAKARYGRVGLHTAMRDSFRKHGATNMEVAKGWTFGVWVGTFAQVGNHRWNALARSLGHFSRYLTSTRTVGEAEQGFLRYLKGAMKIWRRDRKKVVRWMDELIDLEGQAGAALEPTTQKKFWTINKKAQALIKKIDANKPMKVRTFPAWKDALRGLRR